MAEAAIYRLIGALGGRTMLPVAMKLVPQWLGAGEVGFGGGCGIFWGRVVGVCGLDTCRRCAGRVVGEVNPTRHDI